MMAELLQLCSWTCPRLCVINSLLLCFLQVFHGGSTKCAFPSFLQRHEGQPVYWNTEAVYATGTNQRQSYMNITVHEARLEAVRITIGQCEYSRHGGNLCQSYEHLYRMECLQQEDGKFKVIFNEENNKPYYTCVRFELKNQNVLQLWRAPDFDTDKNNICSDWNMERVEWPWLAYRQLEWEHCPMTGGFDFRSHAPINNEQICAGEFKPNRLESECILGEGMTITYPSIECSPFYYGNTSIELMCWSHWIEDSFLFIIAGQPGMPPQFAFRVPVPIPENNTASFRGHMYFSPVTPSTRSGMPTVSDSIQHTELRLARTGPGLCYDESEKCDEYAEKGECSNSPLYQHANLCRRSCGMCAFLPSRNTECHFNNEMQGEWVMFEKDRKEYIHVTEGLVDFSRIGTFICKGKHWESSEYKLLSYYHNGCRPRYTCMQMEALDDHKAQFQISRSSLSDKSFTLCEHFRDDPPPIGSAVRSKLPKLVIAKSDVESNTCGLNGATNITMTTGGATCYGSLSDWNHETCGSGPVLKVSLRGRCSVADVRTHEYEEEFICNSFVALEEDYSLLITKSSRGKEEYSCWIIRTFGERMGYHRWRHAYLLDRAQCGRAADLDYDVLRHAKLSLITQTENIYRPCSQSRPPTGRWPGHSPITVIYQTEDGSSGHYVIHPPRNQAQKNHSSPVYSTNNILLSVTLLYGVFIFIKFLISPR